MSSHPVLPTELFERIIDNLCGDARSLSSCALVCRDWLPRSHFHRFASISLPISYPLLSSRRTKLRALIEENPNIVLYVRSLSLNGMSILGSSMSWSTAQALPPMCPRLVTLRSLSLSRFEFCSLTELLPTICALPALEELSLDRVRVHARTSAPHADCTDAVRKARAHRPLKALRFTGETIGESILEAEASEFASALADAGVLSPGSLNNLALLSGARGCAGWVPFLPSLAPSLQHCALSLHELIVHGELAEIAREHIVHVYDALRPCPALRSSCVQYNSTSTLMQRVFEGATHTIPGAAPFFLDALCDVLSRPGEPAFPILEELSLIYVGSRHGLASCASALDRLARALLDRERYPCVRKLSVRVDEPRYVTGLFRVERGTVDSMGDEQERCILDLLGGFDQGRIEVEVKIRLVEP
ncbi:hypothetical protein C8T65DRAFT_58281 [Cerioporus squamosus]|nr:hypothetical protein C8T65DRAFT_58281 [Cerioporus squamosus]